MKLAALLDSSRPRGRPVEGASGVEETLRSILAIEAQARSIVDEAESRSKEMLARAQAEAAEVERAAAREAPQEAEQIRTAARQAAEEEQARILAEADEEARRLEERARPQLEAAAEVVVRRIARL
jgi:colicin import membrane protein